jgi:mycothiol synthase
LSADLRRSNPLPIMQPIIRPFTTDDYPDVVAVINAATPEFSFTLDAFLAREQRKDPRCRYGRWVAETEIGAIVGMGEYGQRVEQYDPGRFYMNLFVVPQWQGTRLREMLYEKVMQGLESLSPCAVRTFVYEARPQEAEFFRHRGFAEAMRSGAALIDLTTFDFAPYANVERRFTGEGFRILPITELTEDPERDDKLCALYNTVIRDVPPIGERGMLDRDTFVRTRLMPPDVLHDAFFIALSSAGEYVGLTQLLKPTDGNPAMRDTGLTGVHPDWRRRGIALALKIHALREARACGCTVVRTSNASHNEPILELNRQMGYIRSPWHIHFVKTWEGRAE